MKEAKNPSGRIIVFNERNHTYTLKDNGKHLESCTKFVKKFFPKFNVERQSAISAKEYNMSQEEVKQLWAKIRDRASDKGHSIHEYAEAYILGKTIEEPTDPKIRNYFTILKEAIDFYRSEGKIIGSEIILFSPRLGLAGTTDLLLEKNNILHILDWKTNKAIKKDNPYNRDSKGLRPLSHLDNCNYIHYSLQLNLYKKIIEEENYFPHIKKIQMSFIHLKEHDLDSYEVYDMDKEIQDMINENRQRAQADRN